MRIKMERPVRLRGSLTVEAVFVMSLILLIILWIMKAAITMYQETIDTAVQNRVNVENAADTFRKLFLVKELLQ